MSNGDADTRAVGDNNSRRADDSSGQLPVRRRNICKSVAAVVGGAVLAERSRLATAQQRESDVTFTDQQTDGRSVTVDEVIVGDNFETVSLIISDQNGEAIARQRLTESVTDLNVSVDRAITDSQELTAEIYPGSGGSRIAKDTAFVDAEGVEQTADRVEPTLVEADPEAGFNYPYYLYAPERVSSDDLAPLLVEPNNTGTSTDDFEQHRRQARQTIERGTGREVADQLAAPFLVPVFPRPRNNPVDGTHYVHQLDDTTMAIDDGPLERVDLQLLAMINDAHDRLAQQDYSVATDRGVMLNGFSASGNFVDRFSALHPDEVLSVTAGGVNGMPILPIAETVRSELKYHVGVADVESLTGEPFDAEAFHSVNRFMYMGEFDDSDTIPFGDAFTDPELRETALDVYGTHMIDDRFAYSRAVYKRADSNTVFRVYKDAAHSPRPATDDLVRFHERSIAGDDTEAIRNDLSGNVPSLGSHIERSHDTPTVGTEVTFDAGRSSINSDEIAEYEWALGDEATAVGEVVTHAFETEGGHNIVLTLTDTDGDTHQTAIQIMTSADETAREIKSDIVFTDQESNGQSINIDKITVGDDVDGLFVRITGQDRSKLGDATIEESVTNLEVFLNEQAITESQEVEVSIYPGGGGSVITEATAFVTVEEVAEQVDGVGPTLIEADSEAGFNYPYYLYAPATTTDTNTPLLVESNNSPSSTDEFEQHRQAAKRTVEGGTGRRVADRLTAPFLVPVFPRPRNEPVDFTHLVHALDDTTMAIDDGPLERVDLQLLAMIDDAYNRLNEREYPVATDRGIMLNGFSGSGNFTERFTALHPEKVLSVTAGGVNGMPILPVETAAGTDGIDQTVNYPVGIANVESLTGEPFNYEAFSQVRRFLYMGEIDVSDTIPYGDAWTNDGLRATALDVYGGNNMQAERFPSSRAIYEEVGTATVFRMYDRVGHTPQPAVNDIVAFHEQAIRETPVEELKSEFERNVPNRRAAIRLTPAEPRAGVQVAVHAIDTELRTGEPVEYRWQFDQVVEKTGAAAIHSFSTAGIHTVTLSVTDSAGNTYTATEYVSVAPDNSEAGDDNTESAEDGDDESGTDSDTDETGSGTEDGNEESEADSDTDKARSDDTDEQNSGDEAGNSESSGDDPSQTETASSDDGSGPGIGVTGTLSSLGGVAYLLKRRLVDSEQEDEKP